MCIVLAETTDQGVEHEEGAYKFREYSSIVSQPDLINPAPDRLQYPARKEHGLKVSCP